MPACSVSCDRERLTGRHLTLAWPTTLQNPLEKANKIAQPGEAHREGFQTPIDEVDAAARILDPLMVGVREGVQYYGVFFKDYALTEW